MRCLIILALTLMACGDQPTTTGPTIPDNPLTTPTTVPSGPPRADQIPDLTNIRGVTAFGAALLTEEQLLSFVNHVMMSGVNMLRVGAWTRGWCGGKSYIDECCGPEAGSVEAKENLARLLDVTSRIPGLYVQLIPTFTYKQAGAQRAWQVLELAVEAQQAGSHDDTRAYRHVVWETVNEWKHPISKLSLADVVNMTRRLRETGQPVGCDYGGGREDPWEGYYPPELRPHVDYIAFHPPRNHPTKQCNFRRPSRSRLRKIINSFSKPVWIDEPECFISDESQGLYGIQPGGLFTNCGTGTEQYRRRLTTEYMHDVEQAGGVWFTHAVWLFACNRLGWLPS